MGFRGAVRFPYKTYEYEFGEVFRYNTYRDTIREELVNSELGYILNHFKIF